MKLKPSARLMKWCLSFLRMKFQSRASKYANWPINARSNKKTDQRLVCWYLFASINDAFHKSRKSLIDCARGAWTPCAQSFNPNWASAYCRKIVNKCLEINTRTWGEISTYSIGNQLGNMAQSQNSTQLVEMKSKWLEHSLTLNDCFGVARLKGKNTSLA